MPEGSGPSRATFVLRLTRESGDGNSWRGEVEYLQRADRRSVADAADALALVAEWLADDVEFVRGGKG